MAKDQLIHYRVAGNLAILLIHARNFIAVAMNMQEHLPKHPELQIFDDLGPRYATVWNMTFETWYSILALTCDVSTLCKINTVSDNLRKLRFTIFHGLIFPMGMGILAFWIFYIYDRESIFPKKADLLVPFNMNLMCHGGVAIYVLWELAFLPRGCCKKDGTLMYIVIFNVVYVSVLFFTRYVDKGIWCYVFLNDLENDPAPFYSLMSLPIICTFIWYHAQWWLLNAIWRHRDLSLSSKVE